MTGELYHGEFEAMKHNGRIDACVKSKNRNEFLEEMVNLSSDELVQMLLGYIDQWPDTDNKRIKTAVIELGRRAFKADKKKERSEDD